MDPLRLRNGQSVGAELTHDRDLLVRGRVGVPLGPRAAMAMAFAQAATACPPAART